MRILNKMLTALSLCLVVLISGCSQENKPTSSTADSKRFRFYIVTAPINKEQAELARLFLANAANPDSDANSQIILPINSYTIAELCNDDSIKFTTSDQEVKFDSDIEPVVKEARSSIEEKLNGIPCQATPKILTRIVGNLKNASKRDEKLVIIMQIPWESKDIPPAILDNFKKGLIEVADSNNIERVMLFGVSPYDSHILNSAFEPFNQKNGKRFVGSTSDSYKMLQKMKEIRRDVLKRS